MMTRKSLFFYARFFVLLMLAGGVSFLAIPNMAEAHGMHTITIDWVRIFKLDDSDFVSRNDVDMSALPAQLSDRANLRTASPTRRAHQQEGMLGPEESYGNVVNAQRTDPYVKYVKIDQSTGYPVGGEEVGSADTLGPGDIIGIAVRLQNVSEVRWSTELRLNWANGGGGLTLQANHRGFTPTPANHKFSAFTALYTYRIAVGDQAASSGWLTGNPLSGTIREADHYFNSNEIIPWAGPLSLPAIDTVGATLVDATFGPKDSPLSGSSVDPTYDPNLVMKTSPYEFVSAASRHQSRRRDSRGLYWGGGYLEGRTCRCLVAEIPALRSDAGSGVS